VNFNLALTQGEKYMEKSLDSDLYTCKIVFSFGITLGFYWAYCTVSTSWSFTWSSSVPACYPSLRHQPGAQHVIAGQMPTHNTLLL